MLLFKYIKENRDEFENICQQHGVQKLYVFGSGLEERFDPMHSDFDFLVEMIPDEPMKRGELLLSLWEKLESFFERKVDLLTNESLKNPYLIESILKTKVVVYDGEVQKAIV
jgi:predicted nucleotidyltransferase